MGATEEDEEALVREVEIPNTLNIAAVHNEMKVAWILLFPDYLPV